MILNNHLYVKVIFLENCFLITQKKMCMLFKLDLKGGKQNMTRLLKIVTLVRKKRTMMSCFYKNKMLKFMLRMIKHEHVSLIM